MLDIHAYMCYNLFILLELMLHTKHTKKLWQIVIKRGYTTRILVITVQHTRLNIIHCTPVDHKHR